MTKHEIKTEIHRFHWKRYFQYLRIEACARKNEQPDLALLCHDRALKHLALAKSIKFLGPDLPTATEQNAELPPKDQTR